MLGGGSSGAMQLRGRISVVPSGHASPGWIVVTEPPRPPGRPTVDRCAEADLTAPTNMNALMPTCTSG
jgi:hypothetical protein